MGAEAAVVVDNSDDDGGFVVRFPVRIWRTRIPIVGSEGETPPTAAAAADARDHLTRNEDRIIFASF